jgi:hypothetical protein
MGDDTGLGLSSMTVCFDFCSTNVVQLSNQNRFRCHHPLITQLRLAYSSGRHYTTTKTAHVAIQNIAFSISPALHYIKRLLLKLPFERLMGNGCLFKVLRCSAKNFPTWITLLYITKKGAIGHALMTRKKISSV